MLSDSTSTVRYLRSFHICETITALVRPACPGPGCLAPRLFQDNASPVNGDIIVKKNYSHEKYEQQKLFIRSN